MTASLPPVGQVKVAARAPLFTSSMPPPGPGSPSMPTTRRPWIPSFRAARRAPSAMASFWAMMTSTGPFLFSHEVSSSSALSRSQSATRVSTMVMLPC